MHVRSDSFHPYAVLDAKYAFGKHDPESMIALADNRNPHLAWSNVPEGTRSFALICHDPEVPTEGSTVNREDTTVPLDLERAPFYHWVLADLPPDCREIAEGAHSSAVTAGGKAPGPVAGGGVTGINDYTSWFAEDKAMKGDYGSYDGPCPPFNDERMHAYFFTVYALDVASVGLSGSFTAAQLIEAMQGHILDQASIVGLYAINPKVKR